MVLNLNVLSVYQKHLCEEKKLFGLFFLHCSLFPMNDISRRYKKIKKEKIVFLFLSKWRHKTFKFYIYLARLYSKHWKCYTKYNNWIQCSLNVNICLFVEKKHTLPLIILLQSDYVIFLFLLIMSSLCSQTSFDDKQMKI